MRTYKVIYKLTNFPGVKVKFIPSFSPEEAEAEFRWIMRTCYNCDPEIVSVEEAPRNGSEKEW